MIHCHMVSARMGTFPQLIKDQ